jgi:hypothetical protein
MRTVHHSFRKISIPGQRRCPGERLDLAEDKRRQTEKGDYKDKLDRAPTRQLRLIEDGRMK